MTSYVNIAILLTKLYRIMYSIKLDNVIVKQTDNANIAWSFYRATARDYANKSAHVTIEQDSTILHSKDANRLLLDDVDNVSANDILMFIIKKLGLSLGDAKALIDSSPLDLSKNRKNGWFIAKDKKKHTQMHNDELMIVLDALLSNHQNNIKNPENIKKARERLGLTQTQLAEKLGLKSGHRQVARWESGQAEMPDVKWKIMQEFLKAS
ncbi:MULTISPECIES: multiprotein-bridging factor 1 family protein [unclassified Acinetobacter]|uniref:helix-turn-helix domain-containing protein n=1 Tax=unclassified Acinetobacter TaxID=196816 RepID=UPI0035B9F0B9